MVELEDSQGITKAIFECLYKHSKESWDSVKQIQKQNAIIQLQKQFSDNMLPYPLVNAVMYFAKWRTSLLVNKAVQDAPFIPSHDTITCYHLT